jgi:DNA-binding NarL/FixJ family response regulator
VIRLLVADDQALVRGGFRAILGAHRDLQVVAEAGTGVEAVARAAATPVDVALVDVRMPEMDGIEATRRITAARAGCRVIMLTTFDLDEHVFDAFRAGATGFLLKTVSPEQLVSAVRSAHAGDALLDPVITRRMIERFTSAAPPGARPDRRLATLTERERDVLTLVAQGLSNTEIAGLLFVSVGTVKTHVSRILTKLDVRDRVQAVVVAYETGVVRPGEGR